MVRTGDCSAACGPAKPGAVSAHIADHAQCVHKKKLVLPRAQSRREGAKNLPQQDQRRTCQQDDVLGGSYPGVFGFFWSFPPGGGGG
jgi:hypothetical protein